jgi:hypothetical protein
MAKKGKDEHGHEGHHGGLAIGRATGIITGKSDDYPEPPRSKGAAGAKPKDSKASKQKGSATAVKSQSGKKR